MNIRTRLRALILATLLPVAILGGASAYVLVEREREAFERGALDRVRALMTAIDAELQATITPLQLLARSPTLDGDDLTAFRAEARRALEARRGDWANIVVSDAETADMLVNMLVPAGKPLFKTLDPDSVIEAAKLRRPVVGRVVQGGVLNRPLFPVRVPVIRDGKPKYVISAVVETPVIVGLVERQATPSGWAIAVLDGRYRFIARVPAPEQGSATASASLKQALESGSQGFQRGRLLDGSEIYRAFHRSSLSGWSASIAVPRRVVEESLRGFWLLVAAFAGAAILGLWVAWRLASRISEPIVALAAAAPALGRGDASALPPPASVDEVRELSRALGDAAAAIHDREERQRLAEQALRDADRAKDEFLAMLGHELRNPLASVASAAQLLKIGRSQPAVVENVSEILGRQVEHMTRLVDDLLEVGRVTGGKIRLDCAPLDLSRVVSDIVETWRTGERFIHHDIHTDLQAVWISADRARIEQVICNLLDNALKYTPAGGRIDISVRAQGREAVLQVRDTGVGMAPELIGRIFDLFVQGERSLAREQGGLGIGLTMARRLVELHDGTIRVTSDGPGKGATFTVTLRAIERPERLTATKALPMQGARALRILIIEDNADARESLAALLRYDGHEVAVADTGVRGIETAAAHAPHIALIDIGLPDVDGYEVARRLRRDTATRHTRLIALTGYGTREDRRAALAAGFHEHLAKPVELDTLNALFSRFAAQVSPSAA
ncbi:MAG TPA: ATP-binding protein [Burkholderiales bacterium]|nr:ATP-binding protein [Burkholderiales bacterium]